MVKEKMRQPGLPEVHFEWTRVQGKRWFSADVQIPERIN
jgi:hypothetical protein